MGSESNGKTKFAASNWLKVILGVLLARVPCKYIWLAFAHDFAGVV